MPYSPSRYSSVVDGTTGSPNLLNSKQLSAILYPVEVNPMKLVGMFLLVIGASTLASAAIPVAPEIDPASAGSALALLSGAVLVIRGRRRK